jgi:hypothetical protein
MQIGVDSFGAVRKRRRRRRFGEAGAAVSIACATGFAVPKSPLCNRSPHQVLTPGDSAMFPKKSDVKLTT